MDNQKALTLFGIEVPDSLTGSLTELGHDVMTLAELQAKLAKADMQVSTRQAKVPAVGLVVGLVVLVSCVPVALVGLALLLVHFTRLEAYGAFLAVAGGAAVIFGLATWLCLRKLTTCFGAFERSKQEMTRNINWITHVISQGGKMRVPRSPRRF